MQIYKYGIMFDTKIKINYLLNLTKLVKND